ETKTIDTAEILAKTSSVHVEVVHAMPENDRSATGFLAPPQFEEDAHWFFSPPEQSFQGWEGAVDAQVHTVEDVATV
ncbi:histidine phosphatase family protein, partial [Rhizobium ruizarguesonis]